MRKMLACEFETLAAVPRALQINKTLLKEE